MLSNLKSVFEKYNEKCILGFNVFGFEDATAVIKAAEDTGNPVILMTNRVAVSHMPIPVLAGMLVKLAERAKTEVVVHLDHAKDYETIVKAIDNGYSSVMFDGSHLPLEENIKHTCRVIEYARQRNVSVEAEIGAVGYSGEDDPDNLNLTDINEAIEFYQRTRVDALAVAIGNFHRMVTQSAMLDFKLLDEINKSLGVPLVIHGASGIKDEDLIRLTKYGVRKINIGTSLRQAFGKSMRGVIENNPEAFDRIDMFKPAMKAVYEEARRKLELM